MSMESHIRSTIRHLREEIEEQCLLLGKSGSREAKLLAEIERLKAEVQRMRMAILDIFDEAKLHGEECWWRDIRKTCEAALTTPPQEGKGKENPDEI